MKDTDSLDREFTPEALREVAASVEGMRHDLLFNLDEAGADPMAEQHYLLALNALDQAVRFLKIAAMTQSAALRG